VKPDRASLVTGTLGSPGGPRRRLLAKLADRALDAQLARHAGRLDQLADAAPQRDVLVASIYRGDGQTLSNAVEELMRSRHGVQLSLGYMGERPPGQLEHHTDAAGLEGGKFANLNELLGGDAPWTLVVDDDVELPARFLDRLIGIAEHHGLDLAQPAQSLASHAAWPVTRRRRGSLLRESRFVEIGPVTLFRQEVLEELTPFPALRYGWGLDVHWAAIAAQRGWRLGIVDAVVVRHESVGVAGSYDSEAALDEALEFLTDRPFLDKEAAQEVLRTHPLR
jgi:hypothetical protein